MARNKDKELVDRIAKELIEDEGLHPYIVRGTGKVVFEGAGNQVSVSRCISGASREPEVVDCLLALQSRVCRKLLCMQTEDTGCILLSTHVGWKDRDEFPMRTSIYELFGSCLDFGNGHKSMLPAFENMEGLTEFFVRVAGLIVLARVYDLIIEEGKRLRPECGSFTCA